MKAGRGRKGKMEKKEKKEHNGIHGVFSNLPFEHGVFFFSLLPPEKGAGRAI